MDNNNNIFLSDELQSYKIMNSPFARLLEEIATKYNYNRESPVIETQSYRVYDGILKDLGVDVTIKVLINPKPELARYLKKLKDSKVENVIKFYEFFEHSEGLFIATQKVTYNNLRFAISRYKKLDDFDTVFMIKILLSIHVDLLRAGINWFGTEQDIEFTDAGIKLSWNNSIPYDQENPFPLILSKLAGKMETSDSKMLPFPKSRVLEDLLAVSSFNASQISLNNNMKKKEKVSKRLGKGWLALKQYKNDFDYYEQVIYFAVHREFGFVRIKSYNAGQLDKQILNLSKTKNTFVKVLQNYNQGGKTFIISEYSTDGTLFNYINKLKANSISLKEEQIQFFFYSLFEPLKVIQDSPIKSLCMLHIKNIYIENGIPKIGEPVPMNKDLMFQLKEKADVPDFYHTQFKKNPKVKSNIFDTYSLGVLMYKLMYTEYPIFPQKKVHIPTTPAYNSRLKSTLEMLLNEGGLLRDLEKKIEISEEVARQIKLNKKKLLQQKQSQSQKKKGKSNKKGFSIQQLQQDVQKQSSKKDDEQTEFNPQQQNDKEQCCQLCCAQLKDPVKQRNIMLDSLQESPYRGYRHFTKLILVLALYVFLFYFFFIIDAVQVMSSQSKLMRMNVTISTINYQITVDDANTFYKVFNQTDRSYTALRDIGCFVNLPTIDYTSVAQKTTYFLYIIASLVVMSLIIVYKGIQVYRFDLTKTYYNMSNLISNFNLSNFLIFNFFICSIINHHFIFFNQIFKSTLSTCLGVNSSQNYGSTYNFYYNQTDFSYIFSGSFILHFLIVTVHFIMIMKTQTIRYTRIFNPIMLMLPFLLGYTLVVRIGLLSQFYYPSVVTDIGTYGNYMKNVDHISIIGIIPQILFLLELIIQWIIDGFFWFAFDKSRMMLIGDVSSAAIVV